VSEPRVVVLGVGNLLLTDEGVGPATVAYLHERWDFEGADTGLIDGGTSGMQLVTLFGAAEHVVVVDAVMAGEEPGAIYRFGPDDVPLDAALPLTVHDVGFLDAWRVAQLLGPVAALTFVGVQPADVQTPHVGLSDAVAARLPQIEEVVLEELARLGVHLQRRPS
jgi:hydrogenase maturation protease